MNQEELAEACEGYLRKKCILVNWAKNSKTNAPDALPTVWKYVSRYFFVQGNALCYTKTKKEREKRMKYKVILHLSQIKEMYFTHKKIRLVALTGHQVSLKGSVDAIGRWIQFLIPFKPTPDDPTPPSLSHVQSLPHPRATPLTKYPDPRRASLNTPSPSSSPPPTSPPIPIRNFKYTPPTKTPNSSHPTSAPSTPTFNSPRHLNEYPTPSTPTLRKAITTPAVPSSLSPPSTTSPKPKPIPPPRNLSRTTSASPISSPSPSRGTQTSPVHTPVGSPAPLRSLSPPLSRPLSPPSPDQLFGHITIKEGATLRPYKPHENVETYIPYDKRLQMGRKDSQGTRSLHSSHSSHSLTPTHSPSLYKSGGAGQLATSWSMDNIAEWDDQDSGSFDTNGMGWDDWDAIFIKSQSLENISHLSKPLP